MERRMDFILLILIGCFIGKVFCEGPTLKILPSQPVILSRTGEDLGVICRGNSDAEDDADQEAFTEMRFTNPQGEIIQDGVPGIRKYSKNSIKLSFVNPTIQDSGNYTCSAMYRNTLMLHNSTRIEFYDNIRFDECNGEQSLIIGREGKISCKPVAYPNPEINWEKDGYPIKDERFKISPDGIFITSVRNEDRGVYTIEAFVPTTGKDKRQEISVAVHTPPEIIELKDDLRAIEGEQYVVQCRASGFPLPKYTWYDPQSRDLNEVDGFEVNSDDGSLTINKVDRSFGGTYRCRATNPAGEDERSINVVVLVKPVISKFENMTKDEGTMAIFECHAKGEPKPTVSIRREGTYLSIDQIQDERYDLEYLTEGETIILRLTINALKRSDDGLYYCAAENDVDKVETAGHLAILFSPNMSLTPATSVKTWASNPVNLSCIAEANPNATITWKYQNEIIEPENHHHYVIYGVRSYSNLLVKVTDRPYEMDVFGTYTCEAKNDIGTASIEIRLDLATVPGPLSQVLFDKVTSTTITFKFLGPSNNGGLPVTSYIVQYRKDNEPESEAITYEWQKETPYILSNLKPRMHYKFKFAAKNNVGVGSWMDKVYEMPVERVPESPVFVTEMETVSEFSDRFEIKWVIPDDNGEPIQYFEIRYFKVEREISGWKQLDKATIIKIENLENPVYELTGLSPNAYYKVELRAHNKLGNSMPGSVVFRTRTGESTDEQTSVIEGGPLSLHGIIAIIVVAVLIMLVLLDITCYVRFHCGLLYLMRYRTCGQSPSPEKVRDVGLEDNRECRNRSTTRSGDYYKGYLYEDTPMLDTSGNRDGRPADLIIDENYKNKSPKGSKSSIGKSSPV